MEWDSRTEAEILEDLQADPPMWLRIANFFDRNLTLLRLAPPGQLVLWKLEHWGASTTFDRVPASPGLNMQAHVAEMLELGHHLFPYTFTEGNRSLLVGDIPQLSRAVIDVVPIAQKPVAAHGQRDSSRSRYRLGVDDVVLGVGGLLHPAKGLDEIASWFLRSCPDPRFHLLCSVILDDEDLTVESVRARWERAAEVDDSSRIHIVISKYGEWDWMCEFYRTVDAILVNSISDSWGRMVSEPVGFGIPTIARRAQCATNEIVPNLVIVDSFSELSWATFTNALDEARKRASSLAEYVNTHYDLGSVRGRFLSLLRQRTPEALRDDFDRLSADPRSMLVLDRILDH